jgi:hypothetical protein
MNPLPTAELSLDQRIWRYMDLTRFVLLLTRGSLFFASLSQLDDPYEGYMPRSHVKAWSEILGKHFQDIARLKAEVAASGRTGVAKAFDKIDADLRENMTFRGIGAMFGV